MRSDENRWARLPGEMSTTWHRRLKAVDRTSHSTEDARALEDALGRAIRARIRDMIGGLLMMVGGLIGIATGLGVVPDRFRILAGPMGRSPWTWTFTLLGAGVVFILAGLLISDSRPTPWKGKVK
jgi:hypothetical protein